MNLKFNNDIMLIHDKMENILKNLPDNSVDAVITDPPFGVRKKEQWDDKDNFIQNVEIWLNESLRVSKSTVIWFCASRMLPYIFNIISGKEELFHRLHVWNKPEGTQFAGSSNNNIWFSIEPILIFSKNLEITKSFGKDMPFSYDTFQYRTIAYKQYNHQTSKPVSLMRKLVGHYTGKNDLVLDPFAGSCSTAIACIDMGRRCLCIEQLPLLDEPIEEETNPDHYGNGLKRIQKHLDKPKLFIGESDEIDNTINLFEESI